MSEWEKLCRFVGLVAVLATASVAWIWGMWQLWGAFIRTHAGC